MLESQRLVEKKKKITKTGQALNYITSCPKKLTLTANTTSFRQGLPARRPSKVHKQVAYEVYQRQNKDRSRTLL